MPDQRSLPVAGEGGLRQNFSVVPGRCGGAREDFIGIVVLQAIGQSLTLLPLIITLLSNSDPSRATAFAAHIQIMRLGGAETGDVDVVRMLKQLADRFTAHGSGTAQARAVGTLAGYVQREANVLAYIDGFWLAITALGCVALITRAPPGPFTPAPFGFAKSVRRKCGVAVT